jgi:hypothetical protein
MTGLPGGVKLYLNLEAFVEFTGASLSDVWDGFASSGGADVLWELQACWE